MEADLIGLIWYIVKSICLEELSFKSPRKKTGLLHKRERERGRGGEKEMSFESKLFEAFYSVIWNFFKSELNGSFPCNV